MHVSADSLKEGEAYELVIESFDSSNTVQSTLKSETISLTVSPPILAELEPVTSFIDLEPKLLKFGQPLEWSVLEIFEHKSPLQEASMKTDFIVSP